MEHRRREPAPGIFRLVLPLPFPGLRRVNAYLLAEDHDVTLVDSGIYEPSDERDHGWDDVRAAFDAAGFAVEQLSRLIVTHTHIDHYGMAGRFVAETGCELWMHETASDEVEIYRDPDKATRALASMLADHGVDEEDIQELTVFEDWRPFVSNIVAATRSIGERDSFTCGGRDWTVVYTPGHARSHICLHSADDGILISGDHLLPSITPHIDFRRGAVKDPLGEFLASLEKIEELNPPLVLPGHGHPFEDGAARARVVARHHERRLGSILQVIRHDAKTASEISDEIFGSSLLNFERRLALGEALAHLAYLRTRGEIERVEDDDGHFRYRKVQRKRLEDDE